MSKSIFDLSLILALAAVPSPVGAQGSALTNPLVDEGGCIDLSAEYMGCLTFGPPLDEQMIARQSRSTDPEKIINLEGTASRVVSRISSPSTTGLLPGPSAASPSNDGSDDIPDLLTASGHLGAP
jgi:hypothetical protein